MRTTVRNRLAGATAIAAIACVMTACGGSSPSSPAMTGNGDTSADPASAEGVVLRLGPHDADDRSEKDVDRESELNGRYSFTVTEEAIRAAGGTDQGEIDENTGDFTVELHDGTIVATQVYSQGPKAGTTWHGTWAYTFDGKVLKIFYSQDPGDWTTMRVKIRKDGALVFSKILDGDGPEEQALSEAWYTTWRNASRTSPAIRDSSSS